MLQNENFFPVEIRDSIALYTNDFLIAFFLKCSNPVLKKLSLKYIKTYDITEYVQYQDFQEIHLLYENQIEYDDINPIILKTLMKFHVTCPTIKHSIPTFPYASNLHCLQLLYNDGYEVDYATFVIAAKFGSVECLDYLLTHFPVNPICSRASNLLDFAIIGNNMDNVLYLINKYPFTSRSMGFAAKNGNLDLLQLLYKKQCPLTSFTLQMSIESGNIFQSKYLKQLKCPFDENVFDVAAKKGILCLVKCLHSSGCPISHNVINHAILGSTEVVEWLLSLSFTFNEVSFKIAAQQGNLEMLQFLDEHDCSFSKGTFRAAVEFGNLENLIFLHEINCPVDQYTFASAVSHNNIELLDWLLGKSTLDSFTFEQAACYSNLKVIKWLEANKCPLPKDSMVENAELNVNLGVYLYIYTKYKLKRCANSH
eukprot:NODE_131_length_18300_cov_0.442668.p4 type:complete len:425 gc:universal NODE_131_length_18300_cov_0.442668:14757-13483(-)